MRVGTRCGASGGKGGKAAQSLACAARVLHGAARELRAPMLHDIAREVARRG